MYTVARATGTPPAGTVRGSIRTPVAVRRAALASASARQMVEVAARVVAAIPTVTRIGATVEAVRRTAVRAPSRASAAVTPGSRRPTSHAVPGASSGANRAMPVMDSWA